MIVPIRDQNLILVIHSDVKSKLGPSAKNNEILYKVIYCYHNVQLKGYSHTWETSIFVIE